MEKNTVFHTRILPIEFRNEILTKVKTRHQPLKTDSIMFRTIGFCIAGCPLFDLKNDEKLASKFICRIKPEFIITFIS